MKKSQILLHVIIIPFVLLELYSRWIENVNLEYIAKPLLMLWIAAYFLLYSKGIKQRITIVLAFFFSWLGDMFLMLANSNEILFYAGVGGFFIAQLLYIYTFLYVSGDRTAAGYLSARPLMLVPFIVYLAGMLFMLVPDMEGIMIPVIAIYAISLIAMSLAALNRRTRVDRQSYRLVFIGSVFFVVSDSLIAINRFTFYFEKASFIIILTYLTAQYLIMRGLLKEWE